MRELPHLPVYTSPPFCINLPSLQSSTTPSIRENSQPDQSSLSFVTHVCFRVSRKKLDVCDSDQNCCLAQKRGGLASDLQLTNATAGVPTCNHILFPKQQEVFMLIGWKSCNYLLK